MKEKDLEKKKTPTHMTHKENREKKKGGKKKDKKENDVEKRQKELPGGELNPGQPCDRRLY